MKGIRSHIVLVGFMGSGKSTIGRLLAKSMGIGFVDLDDAIINESGCSIKQIFARHGEAYFRELESAMLNEILNKKEYLVIATGGGTPCFYDNMKIINEKSISIYLKVGRNKLVDRLKNDKERPLLQNKKDVELLKFVATTVSNREPFYLDSNVTVRAISTPLEISKRIISRIMKINR